MLYTILFLPASVPPVPVENVTADTAPLVCSHISGPVVSMCALRLAVLSNWLVHIALSIPSAYLLACQKKRERDSVHEASCQWRNYLL